MSNNSTGVLTNSLHSSFISTSSSSSSHSSTKTESNTTEPQSQVTLSPPILSTAAKLNKLVDKFHKSLKYLEQVIVKNKPEIIPTSTTAVLESVIDIFNFIQSISKNLIKSKVNLSLANLVKWSDQVLFYTMKSETQIELMDQGLKYISELKKAVKLMSKSSRKFVQLESESDLVSSLSLSSSSEESSSVEMFNAEEKSSKGELTISANEDILDFNPTPEIIVTEQGDTRTIQTTIEQKGELFKSFLKILGRYSSILIFLNSKFRY